MVSLARGLVGGVALFVLGCASTPKIDPLEHMRRSCDVLEERFDFLDGNKDERIASCATYMSYSNYCLRTRESLIGLNIGYGTMVALRRDAKVDLNALKRIYQSSLPIARITCSFLQGEILSSIENLESGLARHEREVESQYPRLWSLTEYLARKRDFHERLKRLKNKVAEHICDDGAQS